ncbi:MAG: copper chaperone PCu(A)C [Acidobacteria bacterium]|nr:copper chaperone PCu(A)C [Acidobacteriota bacterium]
MRRCTGPALALMLLVVGCADPGASTAALDPEAVAAGRDTYLSNGCANCHGEDGSGRGALGAGFDPPPRDYRDPAAYQAGSDIDAIARTVAEGLPAPGGGMPAFRHLSEERRRDLAMFIVSLQHPDSAVVEVRDPWIGEVIPGMDSTGGWMTIYNAGPADAIVAVEVSGAHEAKLHRSMDVDGMMRMEQLERLELPAEGTVELAPGGLHLMLERLSTQYSDGEVATVTLFLESRTAVRFEAPVRRRDGAR